MNPTACWLAPAAPGRGKKQSFRNSYFFTLPALALGRRALCRGNRRFVPATAAAPLVFPRRTARGSFFLGCRGRSGLIVVSAIFAAWRALAAMVSGIAERLSANSWATLVR